ncbi:hypothetical protein MMC28_000721 [Mycoblastus sanguinarius]|nr:hypothetical protein [Mycoblastus sanguinarius]
MRNLATYILTTLLVLPTALTTEYSPFLSPSIEQSFQFHNGINLNLFRRDSKCPTSCSSMGGSGSGICCGKKTQCAIDEAGNVACCPDNAACTGTISVPGATPTGVPAAGTVKAASPAAMTHAITGGSTVANSYYPYPYLATTFQNAAECTSSYSSCQFESAKCTGALEGGGMDVTVSGLGGGVTQQGAMAPASAESICSSLSAEACHGLALTQCSTLGGAAKTSGGSFVVGGSANAAPTRCAALYGMGVGMAVGLAGQVVG